MAQAGRVALVTGAARRIGAAVAGALHGAGWGVAVHYRESAGAARTLVESMNGERPESAEAFGADLASVRECDALVRDVTGRFGRLDLLVNNASGFFPTPVGETSDAQWEELLASNLKAPYFLVQAARAALAEYGGSVVNITDVHARRPMPGYPVYCIAKAGLDMLTRALAVELGPEVRVNAVAPGAILWPEGEHGDAVAKPEILDRTALRRQGSPEDIAQAVLYLAGAGYVTGHVLVVDGGRSLHT